MRLVILFVAFISLSSTAKLPSIKSHDIWSRLHREPPPPPPQPFSVDAVTTQYFDVRVDHFNAQETRTWRMRYMANDQFYIPGGPIFIYVGAEWSISEGWLQSGHMFDLARKHGGYMFYTEHRYYGLSYPTADASTANLRYNSVDQALADLAYFITFIKNEIPSLGNSKVILVGGSYAATMVTWMRQKYPNLVAGAWASSAPLLAKVDFFEYKEVMTRATHNIGGHACHMRIQEAFEEMELLVWSEQTDRINNEFNLCTPLNAKNKLDVWNFFSGLSNIYAGTVQYHRDGDIEQVCGIITDSRYPDGIAAYAAYVRSVYGSFCLDTEYQSFVDYYSDPRWGGPATSSAYRQWLYQTCSEFGFYQTSSSKNQGFGSSFPLDLDIEMCGDIFGKSLFNNNTIHANIRATNLKYGALEPQVTNVYFTHGDVDPWSALGIKEDYNENAPADVVPGASHCADLYSISSRDTPAMRAVKEKISELVEKWLEQ